MLPLKTEIWVIITLKSIYFIVVLEVFSSPLFSVSSGLKSPLSVCVLKASSWSSVNTNICDIWSNNHAHWKALQLHLATHLSSVFRVFSSAGIQIQAEEDGHAEPTRGHTSWVWRFRLFVKTWPCYWIMPSKLGDTCNNQLISGISLTKTGAPPPQMLCEYSDSQHRYYWSHDVTKN